MTREKLEKKINSSKDYIKHVNLFKEFFEADISFNEIYEEVWERDLNIRFNHKYVNNPEGFTATPAFLGAILSSEITNFGELFVLQIEQDFEKEEPHMAEYFIDEYSYTVQTAITIFNVQLKCIDVVKSNIQWRYTTDVMFENNLMYSDFAKGFYNEFFDVMFNKSDYYKPASTKHFWFAIKNGAKISIDYIHEMFDDKTVSYVDDEKMWREPIKRYCEFHFKEELNIKDFFTDDYWLTMDLTDIQKVNLTTFLNSLTEDLDLLVRWC
jgi:hypothetical protein